MRRDVIFLEPDQTLANARAHLISHGVTGAPVIDEGRRVVGAIDSARQLIDVDAARIADIMRPNPAILHRGDTLEDAVRLFSDLHLRRIPVVDDENRGVGIVAIHDILGVIMEDSTPCRDSDLKRLTHVPRIDKRTRLEGCFSTMILGDADAALITDNIGRVVGIITFKDLLLGAFLDLEGLVSSDPNHDPRIDRYWPGDIYHRLNHAHLNGEFILSERPVSEFMAANPHTVLLPSTIGEIASLMVDKDIDHVPLLSSTSDRVSGVMGALDLVEWAFEGKRTRHHRI